MKLSLNGSVSLLGSLPGDYCPLSNVRILLYGGPELALQVPPETLAELRVGQPVRVSVDTEEAGEPAEGPKSFVSLESAPEVWEAALRKEMTKTDRLRSILRRLVKGVSDSRVKKTSTLACALVEAEMALNADRRGLPVDSSAPATASGAPSPVADVSIPRFIARMRDGDRACIAVLDDTDFPGRFIVAGADGKSVIFVPEGGK